MPNRFDIRFEATEMGVRQTLASLLRFLAAHGIEDEDCGKAELVLAEALNNVVEHAYAGADPGAVSLQCTPRDTRLDITILDQGTPVPTHVFAKRNCPETDVALEELPEGGFGWFLIQTMTENLAYQRVGETNCLRLSLPLGAES